MLVMSEINQSEVVIISLSGCVVYKGSLGFQSVCTLLFTLAQHHRSNTWVQRKTLASINPLGVKLNDHKETKPSAQ